MSTISALQSQVVVPSNTAAEDTTETDEIEEQKLEFLELLIAQVENQNPLDPMDTDEYTNQLIQYSQLDQQLEMKQGIKDLNEVMKGQNSIMALNYMGEKVELTTNAAPVQDGQAVWNYTTQGADDVKIQVLDENKEVLAEFDGKKSIGPHQFIFDAASAGIEDGSPLFVRVHAYDKDGKLMSDAVGITSYATVDGLTGDGQDPYMTAGSLTFGIKDILKVSEPTQPQTVTTAGGDDGDTTGGSSEGSEGSDA